MEQQSSQLTIMIPANTMKLTERFSHVAGLLKEACPRQFEKGEKAPVIRLVDYQKNELTYEIIEGSSRGRVEE